MSNTSTLNHLSTTFNIEEQDLIELGVINFCLNIDTPLFIDPLKLKTSKHPEMKLANQTFLNHFEKLLPKIIEYIRGNKELEEDLIKSFIFHEFYQIPLGYSITKNKGSGMSDGHAIEILKNIKDYFNEPSIISKELFRYIPMFGGETPYAIGVDKISDMTISIIIEDLVNFNLKAIKKLQEKHPNLPLKEVKIKNKYVKLLKSEYSDEEYVLLIPKDILIPEPQSGSLSNSYWDYFIKILPDSSQLRRNTHRYISVNSFSDKEKVNKIREFTKQLLKDKSNKKEILLEFWNPIKCTEENDNFYNFKEDKSGYDFNYKFHVNNLLENISDVNIEIAKNNSSNLVLSILEIFKQSIENNNSFQNISITNKKDDFFLVFLFIYFQTFCTKYGINFNIEINKKDKYIVFYNDLKKYLIEIKVSSNQQIINNYNVGKSFEKHFNKESATLGYYIILDINNTIENQVKKLTNINNKRQNENLKFFIIDANKQ